VSVGQRGRAQRADIREVDVPCGGWAGPTPVVAVDHMGATVVVAVPGAELDLPVMGGPMGNAHSAQDSEGGEEQAEPQGHGGEQSHGLKMPR